MENSRHFRSNIIWLSSIGSLLVVLVVILGISFFSAIFDAQVESRREFLSQQTALASRGLEIELERFQTEYNAFYGYLQSQRETPELALESLAPNTRRLINMFPQLIDTVWVDLGEEVYFFTLTPRNDLASGQIQGGLPRSFRSNLFLVSEENSPTRLVFSLNLTAFSKEFASSFYLNPGGKKFLMMNSELQDLTLGTSQDIEFSSADLQPIIQDVQVGVKGLYEVSWVDFEKKNVTGILAQYPLSFSFTKGPVALVFLLPTESITSGIYTTYIVFFLGIVFLLGLTATFFVISLRNNINSTREIEGNLEEISTLFEQQNLLLEELRGFVFFHDQSGKISRVSEEVENVLDFPREKFISEFSNQSENEVVQKIIAEVKEAIIQKKEYIDLEADLIKSDGQKIRVRVFEKLMYQKEGAFYGGMGICTDITAQYLSRQEVLTSENRLRNLIQSIPDSIFLYDNQGKILDQHIQGMEASRTPERGVLGVNLMEIAEPDQRKDVMATFNKARKTGELQTTTVSWKTDSGSQRHVEMRFFPLDDQQMMSISKDITGQKIWEKGLMEAMQAADQASRAKSQFLANMSHEIRTPMNGLLGIIDLLENTKLNTIQKQYVEIIKNSGNSLLTIIKDILDYSKIESGKIELIPEVFNPEVEARDQIQILGGLAKKKGIQLQLKINSNSRELWVEADRTKINQVLLNLAANAIKFTPEGGEVNVQLNVQEISGAGIQLTYVVKDSGIGIAAENLEKLTEPFFQVESSASRTFQGTGLGLAIAKRMIDLMAGELQIKSALGEGSEFTFSVWVKKVDKLALKPQRAELTWKDVKEMGADFPLKILLVEDNELNLQLMKMMFDQLGFSYDTSKNGLDALEKVKNKKYDVILMDVQMPVLNGIDATIEIRKNPDNKDIIIIGLSANVFEEDQQKAKDAGMDDYLTKPIRLAVLADKLEYYYRKILNQVD